METRTPKKYHQTIKTTVQSFVAALKSSLSESKGTIPVLTHVLIQDQMVIGTTLSSFTFVPFEGKGKGDFLIPRKPAIDLLAGETGALTITFIPETEGVGKTLQVKTNGMVLLQTPDCEFSLSALERKHFPEPPTPSAETFTVSGETLKPILKRTLMAISKEESRYTLNAALFDMERAYQLCIVATDGHRLSFHEIEINGTLPRKTLVIPEALIWIQNNIGPTVHVGTNETHNTITTNDKTIISKRLTGQFPNYQAVMPRDHGMHADFASPEKFKKLLAKVGKAADERSGMVRFNFTPQALILATGGTEAGAKTSVECLLHDGTGLMIGLQFEYVLDFLSNVENKPFQITMKDPQSAVLCRQDTFSYVLMPMRI